MSYCNSASVRLVLYHQQYHVGFVYLIPMELLPLVEQGMLFLITLEMLGPK